MLLCPDSCVLWHKDNKSSLLEKRALVWLPERKKEAPRYLGDAFNSEGNTPVRFSLAAPCWRYWLWNGEGQPVPVPSILGTQADKNPQ